MSEPADANPSELLYEPLEAIREAMQVPTENDTGRGKVYLGGRRQSRLRCQPYITQRERNGGPLPDDIELAGAFILPINRFATLPVPIPEVTVDAEATIHNEEWLAKQQTSTLHILTIMAHALHRAEQVGVVRREGALADQLYMKQVTAETLVSRALLRVKPPPPHWPDPAMYYNPYEIAHLRSQYPQLSNTLFFQTLSRLATNKLMLHTLLTFVTNALPATFDVIYGLWRDNALRKKR